MRHDEETWADASAESKQGRGRSLLDFFSRSGSRACLACPARHQNPPQPTLFPQEYDGGTLMECILAKVETAAQDFPQLIRRQRQAVEGKVLELTRMHVVHPGLEQFRSPGGKGGPLARDSIPGVRESGW